jgi:hypothetical protein
LGLVLVSQAKLININYQWQKEFGLNFGWLKKSSVENCMIIYMLIVFPPISLF